MNLQVTAESGVIASGQPLLDIVPNEPNLVIDSRIKPADIDGVHPAMPARVVLTAYPSRHLPQIHGLLTSVSADRLTDEKTGEPYFLAKVTGEHTLLDYMLTPVEASLTASFREN